MGLLINLAAATGRLWLTYARQWLSRYTARHYACKRAAIKARPSRPVHSSGVRHGVLLHVAFDAASQSLRTREDGMHPARLRSGEGVFRKVSAGS